MQHCMGRSHDKITAANSVCGNPPQDRHVMDAKRFSDAGARTENTDPAHSCPASVEGLARAGARDGGQLALEFCAGMLAKDDARFFHIIRDPRDVLLSGTRYHETTARATYDDLMIATGISRTKISDGLDILAKRNLIVRGPEGRSTFGLTNYGEEHRWAGLPAKPLYDPHWSIPMFEDFHLRKPAELDAVKLYLAFAARRDTGQNVTRMTYNHISDYAGIKLGRIKRALGILNINGLITVESYERMDGLPGTSHGYRLAHLYPTLHAGTTGRATRGPADDLQNYD